MRFCSIKRLAVLGLVAATLAAHSAPRLIVLNKSDNTMVVIDPAALKVLGKVPTGEGPHEAAITADGKSAYVSRTQAGRVDAIDVVKREVVGSVETGNGPDGLAWRN